MKKYDRIQHVHTAKQLFRQSRTGIDVQSSSLCRQDQQALLTAHSFQLQVHS